MPLGSHTPSGWALRGWLPGALSDSSRVEVEGQMAIVAYFHDRAIFYHGVTWRLRHRRRARQHLLRWRVLWPQNWRPDVLQ